MDRVSIQTVTLEVATALATLKKPPTAKKAGPSAFFVVFNSACLLYQTVS
jgi:hypothetical protein